MRDVFNGKRVLVILNPRSGKAKPSVAEAAIVAALTERGADADVRRTSDGEEPERWARGAAGEGYDVVLAAGGDGTVTAVARGVLDADGDVPLGIIPLGTGNGLARVLRLPIDARRAIDVMHAGHEIRFDVVRVEAPRSIALFFLGAGLDAEINRDADQVSKARFGFLAYLAATARNLWGRRNHRIELTLDGRCETLSAHTVTVFNAGQFAFAGLEVGPAVDPQDGLLDVTVLRSPGFWTSLAAVVRLASGQPDAATARRAKSFRVEARPPLLVHVDGDVVGTTPLEAVVMPGALRVIASADYPVDRNGTARDTRSRPAAVLETGDSTP